MRKWTLPVILIILSGCASIYPKDTLFGVSMDPRYASGFSMKDDGAGSFTYRKNNEHSDGRIYAYGYKTPLSFDGITIRITNKSNRPIGTNYFTDSFRLIAANGNEYHLEKADIMSYPKAEYINPGYRVEYNVYLPSGFEEQNIGMIICTFGSFLDRTSIVLKQIPMSEPETSNAK